MEIIYFTGLAAVLVSIAAARMVSESALRKLTQTEIMNLESALAGYKKYSLFLIIPLLFVVWVVYSENSSLFVISVIIFFVCLIAYFIFAFNIARKKIETLGIDKNYLRSIMLSFGIRFLGIAVFCAVVIYSRI